MSKAIAVKRRLKEILEAGPLARSECFQVTFGFPAHGPETRWAAVGEIRWESAEWATNRSREEVFAVTVVFNAVLTGADSEEAEEYVSRIAAEFAQAVSADPSLGGLCVTSTFTPRNLASWPADTTAYEAQYVTEVRARCRP